MTVLELLELQARARAIRSQLAMEPVTKIEIDSDEEEKSNTSNRKNKSATNSVSSTKEVNNLATVDVQRKRKQKNNKESELSKNNLKPANSKEKADSNESQIAQPQSSKKDKEKANPEKSTSATRRIKLKRPTSVASFELITNTEKEEKAEQKSSEIKLEVNSSRESSPDVIAMHPSPETVLLSSDSDTEKSANKTKSSKSDAKSTKSNTSPPKTTPTSQNQSNNKDDAIELSLETEELDYDDHISDLEQPPPQQSLKPVKKPRQYRRKSIDEPNTSNESKNADKLDAKDEQSDISLSSESAAEDWEDSIYDRTGDPENDLSHDTAPMDLREKLRRKRQEETMAAVTVRSEIRTVDRGENTETPQRQESPREPLSRKSSQEKSPLKKVYISKDKSSDSSEEEGFVESKSLDVSDSEIVEGEIVDTEPKPVSTNNEEIIESNEDLNENVVETEVEVKLVAAEEKTTEPATVEPMNEDQDQSETIDVDAHVHKSNTSSSDSESSSDNDDDTEDATTSKKEQQDDGDGSVIDINVSSDDENLANEDDQPLKEKSEATEENQSWGQRWLRSKKVTEVMASSKLGNKVRGKIKEKKIEEKKAAEEKERLDEEERKRQEEEERQREEEEKRKNDIPAEQLGSVHHFKQLKLLNKLKEQQQQRAESTETGRKLKLLSKLKEEKQQRAEKEAKQEAKKKK